MKFINSLISSNLILSSLVSGSPICNPDIRAVDYLIVPC